MLQILGDINGDLACNGHQRRPRLKQLDPSKIATPRIATPDNTGGLS
jgi:hypothetical protein